jgi:nucleoside phosphorylase
MERMRPVVLAAVTGHFVEMFEFSARPSVVVERWLSSLPLEGCCPPIGDSSALEIADIVVESFGEAEMLPGSLSIKRAEIVDVLSEIHQRTRYAAPLAQRELTPVCNVDRVFGGPIPSGRCTVVFTPIRSEFELLCRSAAVKERQGWFSTAIIRGEDERRVVLACASPGGSTADDCLTFLLGAVENVEFVLFIGLAGSVSPVFNVGDVVWPSFVEVQPECARAARIQTVPFAPAFGDMANTRGCVVGSIRCLGDESRDLLELWRWKDVNLIDLEISTVASWCDARQVPFSAVFVVSDRPLDDDPLWKRQPISADGLISKALQKVAETVISSVINRQVAHDAQGEQS